MARPTLTCSTFVPMRRLWTSNFSLSRMRKRPRHRKLFDSGSWEAHLVRCPKCVREFDLIDAPWCRCRSVRPTKICSLCGKCLCDLPEYADPLYWVESPKSFRSYGFEGLLVYYL